MPPRVRGRAGTPPPRDGGGAGQSLGTSRAGRDGRSRSLLSRLYSGLRLDLRKPGARRFGYDETVLVSWFRTLTTLRNMCAHHNRLWNATLVVDQPKQAKALAADLTPPDTFYARAVVLAALLRVVAPASAGASGSRRCSPAT